MKPLQPSAVVFFTGDEELIRVEKEGTIYINGRAGGENPKLFESFVRCIGDPRSYTTSPWPEIKARAAEAVLAFFTVVTISSGLGLFSRYVADHHPFIVTVALAIFGFPFVTHSAQLLRRRRDPVHFEMEVPE